MAKDVLYERKDIFVDSLASMLLESQDINFFRYVNKMGTNSLKLFIAPSVENKLILLNTIMTNLEETGEFTEEELNTITKNILDVYNTINLAYVENSDYTLFNVLREDKNLLSNPTMKKIIDKLSFIRISGKMLDSLISEDDISTKECIVISMQIFTYASIFINMDKLINDLLEYMDKDTQSIPQ